MKRPLWIAGLFLLTALMLPSGAARATTCQSWCLGALMFDCASNAVIGVCAGAWDCTDNVIVSCNLGSCNNDSDCPAGYGCAKWAFKPNECVLKCDRDSDCPGSQKCKKPIGTTFKRCV